MYVKLATRNIIRSIGDYSIYFVTLAFAATLLYSFTASTDYLLSLDLSEDQRSILETSDAIIQAFSLLSVIVFAFLVTYANKFILKRRSKEFAIYGLLGMEGSHVACILSLEGCLVAIGALLIGTAAGIVISPLFSAVSSFVFDVAWVPSLTISSDAIAWTSGCFVAIMALSTFLGIRLVGKKTLLELISADKAPVKMHATGKLSMRLQLVASVVMLLFVWGSCILQPMLFIAWILPMGLIATFATGMLFRYLTIRLCSRYSKNPRRYLKNIRPFTLRQISYNISISSNAMACTCVLFAAGVCMMVAGFAFSAGMRGGDLANVADVMSPIGFIGIFYGITFIVSAVAVLSLQQLASTSDSKTRYRVLQEMGCDDITVRKSLRHQIGLYFSIPFAFSLIHDFFGLALIGFLAACLGAAHFNETVLAVTASTLAICLLYCLIVYTQSKRFLRIQTRSD